MLHGCLSVMAAKLEVTSQTYRKKKKLPWRHLVDPTLGCAHGMEPQAIQD